MSTYTVCRLVRPRDGRPGPLEEVQEIEARDDAAAILNAQAQVPEFDGSLLGIEMTNADDQVIWSRIRPGGGL